MDGVEIRVQQRRKMLKDAVLVEHGDAEKGSDVRCIGVHGFAKLADGIPQRCIENRAGRLFR